MRCHAPVASCPTRTWAHGAAQRRRPPSQQSTDPVKGRSPPGARRVFFGLIGRVGWGRRSDLQTRVGRSGGFA